MSEMKNAVIRKIKNRSTKVTVFGLGRIGLPKAAIIAEAGFQVIGVDLNSKIVEAITTGGVIGTNEPGLSDLIEQVIKKGILKATSNGSTSVKDAGIIIACVPTPIKEDKTPDLSYIQDACKTIAPNLNAGKLVIIECTLPPKATKTFIAPILEEGSGLKCGSDFWLVYCPERITIGKALEDIVDNDRIVGGYNAESAELATKFLETFARGNIQVTDSTTAEVAKLAENAVRDVNIAFANQLALICEQHRVDAKKVIELANTHPRVNIHTPGPGVGGPCLPKDPYLLINKTKPTNYDVINAARRINDYMPKHIVKLILEALKKTGKNVRNSRIAVLGTAYKGNVNDSRLSPSEPIIHELVKLSAETTVYDPHCNEIFEAKKAKSLHDAIKDADCLAIITDHTEFKNLNLQKVKELMNEQPAIIDGKRIIDSNKAEKLGFTYYGVGFGKMNIKKATR